MKSRRIFFTILTCSTLTMYTAAQYSGNGHLPFDHDHSTRCSGSGGVCYGYAMGIAAGSGINQSVCDPATVIPPNTCGDWNSWMSWGVNGTYWTQHSATPLVTSGAAIIQFNGHVAYASGAINGQDDVTVYNIRAAGETPTSDVMHKQGNGSYKLSIPGHGDYYSQSYWTVNTFDVTAKYRFYNGTTPVDNVGEIGLAGYWGNSPLTKSLTWNGSYTATAESPHNYPSGYQQIFSNQWTQGGSDAGTTLQIGIVVTASQQPYQAEFHRAAPITLTPAEEVVSIGEGKRGTLHTQITFRCIPIPSKSTLPLSMDREPAWITYSRVGLTM